MSRASQLILLLIILAVSTTITAAQDVPNRDELEYDLYEAEFDWLEIEDFGEQLQNLQDNSYRGPFEIGFEFPFYGRVYESFYLSVNGFIGFGPPQGYGSGINRGLPYHSPPHNIIALLWKEFDPDAFWADGSVYFGVRDNKLVVQFQGYAERNPDGIDPDNTVTMQVILEGDGDIILQYHTVGDEFNLMEGTVGVEGPDGTDGLTVRHDGEGVDIANETAYLVSSTGPLSALIWDAGDITRSGTEQSRSLEHLGFDVTHLSPENALPDDLDDYFAVFVNLGNFGSQGDNYHQLSAEEGDILAGYLENGGALYLEGSNTWYLDRAVEVHRWFNIHGLRNGRPLEPPITGIEDSFVERLTFHDYRTQDNDFVDQLRARNGATEMFNFRQGEIEVVGMVANVGDGFKTVGSSFEFGGMVDGDEGTKHQLMANIIQFFHSPAPQFPAPHSLWGEVDDSQVTLHWEFNEAGRLMARDELEVRRQIAALALSRNGVKPTNRERRMLIDLKRDLAEMIAAANERPERDEFTVFNIFVDDELYDQTNSQSYNVLELENGREYEFSVSASYEDPDGESERTGSIGLTPGPPLSPPVTIDFEDNNGGLYSVPPENGWEWGEPAQGAASGSNAWGTGLDQPYQDNSELYLYSPNIDLTERQQVWLTFNHSMDCEADWDGGRVELTIDDGERWAVIRPRGGYPSDNIFSFGAGEGYTGTSDGWIQAEFDLSDFVGNHVRIRFVFISDESNFRDQQGWFIDDLALIIPALGTLSFSVFQEGDIRIHGALVQLGGLYEAYTGSDGSPAFFRDVPADTYDITASKIGFVTDTVFGRVILPNQQNDYSIELVEWNSSLRFEPDLLEVILEPGETTEEEAVLSNRGDIETRFQIYIDDFPGNHEFRGPQSLPRHGDLLELLQTYDLTSETGEQHFVGAQFIRFEYPESYRLVAVAGAFDEEHPQIYHYDRAGDFQTAVRQGGNINNPINDWGLRDLAYDGDFLYGSFDNRIMRMSPLSGDTMVEAGLPSPLQLNRAITYVPADDAFWVGNSDDTWYKLSREGEILDRVLDHGLERVAGMAWNPVDPDGAHLYVHNQESEDGGAAIYRYNPRTREVDEEPILTTAQVDGGFAGGAFITHLYDTNNYTLGVVIQGENGDQVKLYALQPRQHWLTVEPNFSERIDGNEALALTLTFNTQNYIDMVLNARVEVYDVMRAEVDMLDVLMDVGGEWAAVSGNVEVDQGEPDIAEALIRLGDRTVNPVFDEEEEVFTYSFDTLYPGEYTITAYLEGYLPFEGEQFELEMGEQVVQDILFEHLPIGTLICHVTSFNEDNLDSVDIVAFSPDEEEFYFGLTDEDGIESFALPAGAYTVRALKDEWRADPVENVVIEDDQETQIDIEMDDRLAVVGLRTDGYFDDQIQLTWLPPGTRGEPVEMIYDDGILVNGATLNSYDDLLACRFVVEGEYDILSVSIYFASNLELRGWGLRNNGNNRVHLQIFDETEESPGQSIFDESEDWPSSWFTVEPEELRFLEGPFYVGWNMSPNVRNNEYMGIDGNVDHEGIVYARIDGEWGLFDRLPGDPLIRAVIWSHFEDEIRELSISGSRTLRRTSDVSFPDGEVKIISLATTSPHPISVSDRVFDWRSIYRRVLTPRRDPYFAFKVYVDGELAADNVWDLDWLHEFESDGENVEYTYSISALFMVDQEVEEIQGEETVGIANMAPDLIRFTGVDTDGLTYTVRWQPPIRNEDNTFCVDYDGCEIFVNDEQVDAVGPDVREWQGEIAEGEEGWYEIALVALDEVPNRSAPVVMNVALGGASVYDFEAGGTDFDVDPFGTWSRSGILHGPEDAHSGVYAWGTRPRDDEYADDADWTITLRDEFLVDSPNARCDFYHYMSSDEGHDGGQILISVDDGPWQIIFPEGGYPDETVAGLHNTPGFTGQTEGWELVSLDLADVEGSFIKLRWRFGSDASINWYPGWFIDDLVIWGCSLVEPVEVSGTIIDQDGNAIGGVSISGGRDADITDANGRFELEDLLPIVTTFTAARSGYPQLEVDIELEPGVDVERNFQMNRVDVVVQDNQFVFIMGAGARGEFDLNVENQSDIPLQYRARIIANRNINRDSGVEHQLRSTHERGPRRDLGESVFTWNLTEITQIQRIQGVEFVGDRFFLTAGDAERGNLIVELDWTGNLVDSYAQPVDPVGWGLRDLAWDGELLYGSQDGNIVAFNLEGEAIGSQRGAPLTINRALTYDPEADGFWAGEWDSPWYLVDREGEVQFLWDDHGLDGVYGFAYHPEDVDGLWLYVLNDDGDGLTVLYRVNPYEEEIRREAEFSGRPTGCFVTGEWDSGRWLFGCVLENGDQYLQSYEISGRIGWINIDPPGGEIEANDVQATTLSIQIPEQAQVNDTYSAEILIRAFEGSLATISFNALISDGFAHFQAPEPVESFMEITVESATVNDTPIPAGSEIAVLTPGERVGGLARWLNLPVELKAYGGENGFDQGNRLDFRLWDFRNDMEYTTEVQLIDGWDVFLINEHAVVRLSAVIIDTQVVSLASGWNLSSIHVRPDELSVATILGEIDEAGNLILAKDFDGAFWYPARNFNALGDWEVLSAYQIAVAEEDEFTVIGRKIPPETEITLTTGWNHMSYLLSFPLEPQIALADYVDDILMLKNGFGEFVVPELDFWGIEEMQPGEGYKVSVLDDIEFVYNSGGELANIGIVVEKNEMALPPTGSDMSILITSMATQSLGECDRIEILAGDSRRLVGRVTITEPPIGVIVRGDDLKTEFVDGALVNDQLSLVLRGKTDVLSPELILRKGEMIYGEDELVVLELGEPVRLPTKFGIENITPNPFNDRTRVNFSLVEASDVHLTVRDLAGRKIHATGKKRFEPGFHAFEVDAGDWASGIYIVEVRNGKSTVSTKIALVR